MSRSRSAFLLAILVVGFAGFVGWLAFRGGSPALSDREVAPSGSRATGKGERAAPSLEEDEPVVGEAMPEIGEHPTEAPSPIEDAETNPAVPPSRWFLAVRTEDSEFVPTVRVLGVTEERTGRPLLDLDGPDLVLATLGPGTFEVRVPEEGPLLACVAPGSGVGFVSRRNLLRSPGTPYAVTVDRHGVLDAEVRGTRRPSRLELAGSNGGEKIPGAPVRTDELQIRKSLDATGQATVPLCPGVVWEAGLWSGAQRWPTRPVALRADAGEIVHHVWDLEVGTLVEGKLTDSTRRSVEGRTITLSPLRDRPSIDPSEPTDLDLGIGASGPWSEVEVDGKGRFEFEEVPTGLWCVALRSGTKDSVAEPVVLEISPGRARYEVTLEARDGLPIRGTVLSPEGAPVDAELFLGSALGQHRFSEKTATDGSFETAARFPDGEYWVIAESLDHAQCSAWERVAAGGSVTLRLRELSEVVVEARGSVPAEADRRVWLFGGGRRFSWDLAPPPETSGEEGIPAGDYDVVVVARQEERSWWGRTASVRLTEGRVSRIEVFLEESATLELCLAGSCKVGFCELWKDGILVGSTEFERSRNRVVVPEGEIELRSVVDGVRSTRTVQGVRGVVVRVELGTR